MKTGEDLSSLSARLVKLTVEAATEPEASFELERFAEKWDGKYPQIAKSWQTHWANLITIFDYPADIRKAIYTTIAVIKIERLITKVIS